MVVRSRLYRVEATLGTVECAIGNLKRRNKMEVSTILMTNGGIVFVLAILSFISIVQILVYDFIVRPRKKIRRNKDSIWVCHCCKLRYLKNVRTVWTWKDVANRGTPVCEACDSDMDLDVEATENL